MKGYALYFAWVVALGGLFLSVFFGEVLDMEPCRLCWYQRIGLFPLALFLGIASYKNDRKIAFYCLPLVAFGGFFAVYQLISQIFPALQSTVLCGESGHCTFQGFAPLVSSLGFAAIALLILIHRKETADNSSL